MSEPNLNLRITGDRTQFTNEMRQAGEEISAVQVALSANMRFAFASGVQFLQVFGAVLGQTYTLALEATASLIEFAATTATAIATSTLGANLYKIGFQAATMISLLVLANQLRQNQNKAARQTSSLVAVLRMGQTRV